MKQLSFMDKGFLLAESREVPMHVGGVNLYTLPEGADTSEFLHGLAANLAFWHMRIAPALADMVELYNRVPGAEAADTPYRQSVTESDVQEGHG